MHSSTCSVRRADILGHGAARPARLPPLERQPSDVTRLIGELEDRPEAWSELMEVVYGDLQQLARSRMSHEQAGHTLQATALVNEAFLRLSESRELAWKSRGHFFGAAAEAMRRVLVDHARKARAAKRGGAEARLRVTLAGLRQDADPDRLIALDEALSVLAREDERAFEVARLRLLCGLEMREVALALDVSERTAAREWAFARARLSELLGDDELDDDGSDGEG